MRTADRQHIGLRIGQKGVNELRDLFAIADEGREMRGELPYDACTIHACRGCGHEYVVKDLVDRVPYDTLLSLVKNLY